MGRKGEAVFILIILFALLPLYLLMLFALPIHILLVKGFNIVGVAAALGLEFEMNIWTKGALFDFLGL